MKRVTLANYRDDPLFPRIVRASAEILRVSKVVAPVDLFVRMGLLAPADLERWRRGRVDCLERVIGCNLSKAGRVLRILRMHAHDLNLVAEPATYRREGRGSPVPLRFSKSGERPIEAAYGRHFRWPGKKPHPVVARGTAGTDDREHAQGA